MLSLEITLAYLGLVLVFVTWGIDKSELLEGNKKVKKMTGILYIILGIFLLIVYILFLK